MRNLFALVRLTECASLDSNTPGTCRAVALNLEVRLGADHLADQVDLVLTKVRCGRGGDSNWLQLGAETAQHGDDRLRPDPNVQAAADRAVSDRVRCITDGEDCRFLRPVDGLEHKDEHAVQSLRWCGRVPQRIPEQLIVCHAGPGSLG
jgi:hypothetical protein